MFPVSRTYALKGQLIIARGSAPGKWKNHACGALKGQVKACVEKKCCPFPGTPP